MIRVTSFSAGSQVPSATLNAMQDRVVGIYEASGQVFGHRPVLSSTGTTNLVVSAHGTVCMGSAAGTAVALLGAGATVSTGSLANNTWYYLYAYNSGSYSSPVLSYEVSTTAPSADLTQKSGDATRTYLGCFRTDGSANILPFRTSRHGRYLYRWSALAGTRTDLLCLSAGASASFADVILRNASLVSLIPPHARLATMRAMVNGAIGTYSQVRTKGDTSDSQELPALLAAPGMAHFDFEIETDSSLTIQYDVGTATDLTLYVTGWWE